MYMYSEHRWNEGSLAHLGTWQLALIIAGPICVVCLAVMLGLSLWTQHRKQQDPYTYPPEVDGPDQPILGAVSLRDMIEMTTSGSGSGRHNSFYLYCTNFTLLYVVNSFKNKYLS